MGGIGDHRTAKSSDHQKKGKEEEDVVEVKMRNYVPRGGGGGGGGKGFIVENRFWMSFIARIFLLCKEDEEELEKKKNGE